MSQWQLRPLPLSLLIVLLLFSTGSAARAGDLFLVDSSGLYTLNVDSADKTLVGPGPCDGLALSPEPSRYLFCSLSREAGGGFLYALETDGSGLTYVATIDGDGDRGLAFNTATGVLYGTDNLDFGVIDPETGSFTLLTSPASEPESLAADPVDNLVYGIDRDGFLLVYDAATGLWAEDPIVTGVDDGGKGGLAFDPDADLLYFIETDGDLLSIEPADGTTLPLGTVPDMDEFSGLTFLPRYDPVPVIRANGLGGQIVVDLFDRLFLTIEIDGGELVGVDGELWIAARTPSGWLHFDWMAGEWLPGRAPSYAGPIFELDTEVLWDSSEPPGLEIGRYTFILGIDTTLNGRLDGTGSFQDEVQVRVKP